MATLQSYFRIITPVSSQKQYTQLHADSTNMNGPNGFSNAASSVAFLTQVMKGAGTRMQRYIQYDSMDNDIDISRALDIIAEEISNDDETTNLPFEIEYQTEDDQEVSENTVTTIRAALRQWSRVQDFSNRIFRIGRIMSKYGDCFFKKSADTKKWEYLDPSKVLGIYLDENGDRVAYQLKGDGGGMVGYAGKVTDVEVVPAAGIIHFTLSDDMGESAPFGESVLQPIFRTFKQLSMLEDSVIIYRLVRAPERRVFYVDVGNMPQQRVKQYLENIKNEIRQKRMPNTTNNQDVIDGTYNPNSISEDYYFPVTASGRSSRVEVLPGGENLGELNELKYFREKLYKGLRVPTSYLGGADAQPQQYNDGKLGVALLDELRFANYIRRLQNKIECVMDEQFKLYLKTIGINVEDWLFLLRLPEPQNFGIYRQNALDSDLINAFKSIEDVKQLSMRWKLKRYLGLTEDDLQMNEKMLKQELEIDEDANVSDLRQIYDPVQMEARQAAKIKPKHIESDEAPAGGGGGGDELGMDMGGGSPPPGDDLGGGLGGDLGGGLGGGADDMGLGAPGAGGGMDNLGL
jgi:hypothetical protein